MASKPLATAAALGSVLVTGGCGFLGSHIVSLLLTRHAAPGTRVAVMDLRTSQNNFPDVTYHAADLTSPDAVRDVLARVKPDVVIHTASPVFSSVDPNGKALMQKVNVDGTRIMLEESKKAGVKAFVYTSSASVISDTRTDLINADERWFVIRGALQKEYYSDTKAAAEELVIEANTRPSPAAPTAGPLTCALRPSAIFGERDVQLASGMIGALRDGRTGFQLGDNDNLFDFTYVGNVAHAHVLAAGRLLAAHAAYVTGALAHPAPAVTTADADKAAAAADEEDADDDVDRVDGEPFLITNASPVYFWDFARALWAAYHAAGGPGPAPVAPGQARVLSRDFALVIGYAATWGAWLLRMPAPQRFEPARLRYSCMTRYFGVGKARALLGYAPVWDLDEGVARTAKWFAARNADEAGKKDR